VGLAPGAASSPAAPAPTVAPAAPTSPGAPTAAPPTTPPAQTPQAATAAPQAATTTPSSASASPTARPVAETGPLIYAEDFSAGRGWPSLSGQGWSVGFTQGGYQITAVSGAGNIWSYATSPAGAAFLLGIDVVVVGGLGGLLLRYSTAGYLAFFVNPDAGGYRLERRDSGGASVLIEEVHPAIATDLGATNRLVARLEEDALELRINGQPMTNLSLASPPPTAQYGMVAVARDDEVVATFSKLTIRGL
ncbi:MAG: hypothetical protein HGA45_19670, partial [Chloroflexales bacterium]|nr:hypothetical protein [Chloroflexales bacterium]